MQNSESSQEYYTTAKSLLGETTAARATEGWETQIVKEKRKEQSKVAWVKETAKELPKMYEAVFSAGENQEEAANESEGNDDEDGTGLRIYLGSSERNVAYLIGNFKNGNVGKQVADVVLN